MITGVFGVLGVMGIWFSAIFGNNFMGNKDKLDLDNTWPKVIGIGSFAPTSALCRAEWSKKSVGEILRLFCVFQKFCF
ncbi:MAG: hypothetical protein COA82_09050 [Alkaliphilus sp.]|nr:hypothetical protein [Alkaliphilus sp. AH-315-G20]MBN4069842.1 hypothetical protein [bacterium AH-315-G05]PHS32811.1 MAG: hypothetical protein COA82_09050 [Alkaliphilus sp.]